VDSFRKQKQKHTLTRRNPPKSGFSPPIYPLPAVLPTPPLVPRLSEKASLFSFEPNPEVEFNFSPTG
jgi:hypothetical protein